MFTSLFIPSRAVDTIKKWSTATTWVIFGLLGISIMLYFSQTNYLGRSLSTSNIFVFSLVCGIFSGLFAGFLHPWMYYKISENFFIINPEVKLVDIRKTIAFTHLPLLLLGVCTVIEFLVYGDIIFNKVYPVKLMVDISPTYYYIMEFVKIFVMLWVFIFSILVLAKIFDINILQAIIMDVVCALLVYGLGKILIFIIFKVSQ